MFAAGHCVRVPLLPTHKCPSRSTTSLTGHGRQNPNQQAPSRTARTFLLLLTVNELWNRLVRVANGDAIFDLLRFLLPYIATTGSSMYFPYLIHWIHRLLAMSPHDKADELSRLFVNRDGQPGHGKVVDLEFEYFVCALKRMSARLPQCTAEAMSN